MISTIKRFLYPIILDPWLYVRGFCMYGLWAIHPIIHVVFLKQITFSLENLDKSGFKSIMMNYIIFIIIYEILEFFVRSWGWTEVADKTQSNIHGFYINKFVKLDNNKTESLGTGRLISIMEKGLSEWGILMNMSLSVGLSVFFTLIFTVYMLFKSGFLYGLIFIIIFVLLHIIGYYLNNKVIRQRNVAIRERHSYVRQLIKIIMSKFEILQSGNVGKEIEILDRMSNNIVLANKETVKFIHPFFRLPKLFISLVKIFVFGLLGSSVLDGSLPLSVLVGLLGALILMDKAINESMTLFKDVTKRFHIISSMWDFFDNTKPIKGYVKGEKFKYKKGDVELKNISFGYNESLDVFSDFSLKIHGERVTALVGNSGGGKSTLVKLISGYIEANSGKILIDGQDLKDLSLKSYYKEIGYLTQEPSVFDGTILENLTYATGKDINSQEIEKIISLAKCEFIYKLPKGIETEIGERGIKLSGGQRQRLAIAKIFLKNPKIIILDEPTSALDSFSEELITKAMHNLFKGRTVIIIAHRLQTVKHADKIFVIEGGEVVEEGNHKELVKKKGIYKRMLDLQSGF